MGGQTPVSQTKNFFLVRFIRNTPLQKELFRTVFVVLAVTAGLNFFLMVDIQDQFQQQKRVDINQFVTRLWGLEIQSWSRWLRGVLVSNINRQKDYLKALKSSSPKKISKEAVNVVNLLMANDVDLLFSWRNGRVVNFANPSKKNRDNRHKIEFSSPLLEKVAQTRKEGFVISESPDGVIRLMYAKAYFYKPREAYTVIVIGVDLTKITEIIQRNARADKMLFKPHSSAQKEENPLKKQPFGNDYFIPVLSNLTIVDQIIPGQLIGKIALKINQDSEISLLNQTRNVVITSAIISLVVTLAAIWFLVKVAVLIPLGKVRGHLSVMSDGDLTQRIPYLGENEMGQVGTLVNTMSDNLAGTIRAVTRMTKDIHDRSFNISVSMDKQAATAMEQTTSVSTITTTMKELSNASNQIATLAGKVLDLSNNSLGLTARGTEEMDAVIAKMGEIVASNQESRNTIVGLGKSSREITRIVGIINNIANQTKLLALNATLEAESASESGNRFGLVAMEIRRLADSVTDSSRKIDTQVEDIKDTIDQLVIESEIGTRRVKEGMDMSARTSVILEHIVEGVRVTNEAAQRISLSTHRQEASVDEALDSLQKIGERVQQSASAINSASENIRHLAELARNQQKQVEAFQLPKC